MNGMSNILSHPLDKSQSYKMSVRGGIRSKLDSSNMYMIKIQLNVVWETEIC